MKLLIDKLSLIYTVTDYQHYLTILGMMYSMKDSYVGKGKHFWKSKYSTNVKVSLDSKCAVLIKAGTSHYSNFVKFEFNVDQLSQDGWDELLTIFTLMFPNGYSEAFEKLRMDYVEVAIDVEDVAFAEINAIDKKVKQFDEGYKKDGSVYFGSKKSCRGFIVYDKAKQLKDVKGIQLGHELTRIECRLRLPKLTLAQIVEIKNPFVPLVIFDTKKTGFIPQGKAWERFVAFIKEGMDAQAAYLSLDVFERKAIELQIFKRKMEWWNPHELWQQALECFTKLTPQYLACN